MNPALTPLAAAQLQEGINLVLSRWAALRMAVENEWGGRDSHQKSHNLGNELFLRLTQSKEQIYIDDLEDILDEFMLSLNAEIEDGSIEEIAERMMIMHEQCLEGNFDSIIRLRETNAPIISYNRQSCCTIARIARFDDEEDDAMGGEKSMEMEVDTPQAQLSRNRNGSANDEPRVKEVADGWTVVTPRRNRGKRN